MYSFRTLLFLGTALTLASGPARAALPLSRLVPENAAVVFLADDVAGLAGSLKKSPFWRTVEDPEIQRFFSPLIEQLKWADVSEKFKDNTGYAIDDVWAMLKRDGVLYIADIDFVASPETRNSVPLVMAMSLADDGSKFEEMLDRMGEKAAERGEMKTEIESYAGERVRVVTMLAKEPAESPTPAKGRKRASSGGPKMMYWGVIDGIFAASPTKPALFTVIDAIKRGGVEAPLERSPRYVRLRERVGRHQMSALIHVPALLPPILGAMEKNDGKAAARSPVPIRAIVQALGLDKWTDLYFAAQVDEDATLNHYGVTATDVTGFLSLLVPEGAGAFPRPTWIPQKWSTVSTCRADFKVIYAGIEQMLRAVDPGVGEMAMGYVDQFGKRAGIDIKRDLIGSLGDEVVQAQLIMPDATTNPLQASQLLYAFSVNDATGLRRAADALMGLAGPAAESLFEKRAYLGQTIHSIRLGAQAGAGEPGLSYAIADRYLFIGATGMVEAALQNLSGQGDSYWDLPDVRDSLQRIPENASLYQRQEMAPAILMILNLLASVPTPANPETGKTTRIVDPDVKLEMAKIARYWRENLSWAFRDQDGLHMVSRMAHPQP